MYKSLDKQKKHTIVFRLEEEKHAAVTRHARNMGMSLSAYMRMLCFADIKAGGLTTLSTLQVAAITTQPAQANQTGAANPMGLNKGGANNGTSATGKANKPKQLCVSFDFLARDPNGNVMPVGVFDPFTYIGIAYKEPQSRTLSMSHLGAAGMTMANRVANDYRWLQPLKDYDHEALMPLIDELLERYPNPAKTIDYNDVAGIDFRLVYDNLKREWNDDMGFEGVPTHEELVEYYARTLTAMYTIYKPQFTEIAPKGKVLLLKGDTNPARPDQPDQPDQPNQSQRQPVKGTDVYAPDYDPFAEGQVFFDNKGNRREPTEEENMHRGKLMSKKLEDLFPV